MINKFCFFRGDVRIVETLILRGADVNKKDKSGQIPLHKACYSNNRATVNILLKHKSQADAKDCNQQTPLHIAAANNSVHCAKHLVPYVQINAKDRFVFPKIY